MSLRIPFIDLHTHEKEKVSKAILDEIRVVFESSDFILGKKVSEFEAKFASMTQCKFAIGVNSGLDALILSLRALGVGSGDEVITAPNSFVASSAAIALVGATPVFADVGWDYNLNPDEVTRKITPKTRAIIPIHLTGNPCKMDSLLEIAQKYNLKLIEDAAQAVGAAFHGRSVGGFGDVGCFSLHPLKNLHVWGDGGVITTNNEEIYLNLIKQRNHGLKNRDEVEFYSYNSRLDSIQAIVGLAMSESLEEVLRKRRENALYYLKNLNALSGQIRLPEICSTNRHGWHVFQLWTHSRDALKVFLQESGIETKVHYPIPLHLQKASHYLGYKRGDFPVAEQLAEGILSLPIRENLERSDLEFVCNQVHSFFEKRNHFNE